MATQRTKLTEWSMPLSPEGRGCLYGPVTRKVGGRNISIVYRVDREILERYIPEPLELPDDPVVICRVNEFKSTLGYDGAPRDAIPEFGQFWEGTVCVPVVFEGEYGNYDPYIWNSDDAGTIAGREIWGLPKKLGNINLTRHYPSEELAPGLSFRGTVERHSRRIMTLDLTLTEEGSREDIPDVRPFYGLRLFPSPEENGEPIRELIRFELSDHKLKRMWHGDAAIEFGESETEELVPLTPKEVIAGYYTESEWWLGYGKIVHRG